MIKMILETGGIGLMLGLSAAVYRGVLAYEEPFSAWWRFGSRFEGTLFFRVVWECEKCFAGQLALWTYLLLHLEVQDRPFAEGRWPVWDRFPYLEGYSLLGHLFTVVAAIFSALVFIRIINKHK